MEDILSEIDVTQNARSVVCSKLALAFGILSCCLLVALFMVVMVRKTDRGDGFDLSALIAILMLLSMITGLLFTIISLVRKEKIKYIKTLAAIINFTMLAAVLGLVLIGLMETYKK